MINVTSIKNTNVNKLLLRVLPVLCFVFLFSFYALVFFPIHARKIFYTAGYITILLMLVFFREMKRPKEGKATTLSIIIFACSILGWCFLYQNHGNFKDVYVSYEAAGKILLFTACVIFSLSNFKFELSHRLTCTLLIIGGLCVNAYAIYQGTMVHRDRVELAFDRATMAAYIITFIDIFMLYAVLELKKFWRYVLFFPVVLVSFAAIVYTETRAAILAYPVLILLLLFFHHNVNKKHLITLSTSGIAILVLAASFFHTELKQRVTAFNHDIIQYEKQNSNTSIGSRFVMFETGIYAGLNAPLGESAESRAEHIKQLIKDYPGLSGAAAYLDVHLHNELIDNFSLRGIWGAGALLLFYAALLIGAWRDKNPLLLTITLSMIVYGLSDVLFFSREGTIMISLAVILATVIAKNSKTCLNQVNT